MATIIDLFKRVKKKQKRLLDKKDDNLFDDNSDINLTNQDCS